MSFNVRYAEPTDGPDIWEYRRPIVARMIEHFSPDVVGTQEPEIDQLNDMVADLPLYKRIGMSRYGNDFEKFAAILYKPSVLALEESGMYWFSETPDVPGSASWLIHKPYSVNWARFVHLETGRRFAHHNAQFPYKPEQATARLKGAEIMSERSRPDECVILTGDFNCDAGGEVYRLLTEEFEDAWQNAPQRFGPEGTFHGFKGVPHGTLRLDWILSRGKITPELYQCVTYNEGGRYPTDHFPVFADYTLDA